MTLEMLGPPAHLVLTYVQTQLELPSHYFDDFFQQGNAGNDGGSGFPGRRVRKITC